MRNGRIQSRYRGVRMLNAEPYLSINEWLRTPEASATRFEVWGFGVQGFASEAERV